MQPASFHIRGVIEGFYGPFYTAPERNDLIEYIGKHGYNLYIYGPKNDRQHRNRWREPYPAEVLAQFGNTVALAREAGVRFCYAISPLHYDPALDFERLTRKLQQLFDCGVRDWSLLVDDLLCAEHHQSNCTRCPWPADVHSDVCNRLYAWLQSLDSACTLSMCPTHYHGRAPFGRYLYELGSLLHPRIDIFYTGMDICSPQITTADAQAFAEVVRRPPLIWDNYPVNDLAMRHTLHLGPIRGRDATLYRAVRGVVVNPMLQPEASKIVLRTFAEYFADPEQYAPWDAWQRALRDVGGAANAEALLRFAENSLQSCLPLHAPQRLEQLVADAITALQQNEWRLNGSALLAFRDYCNILDEACYTLKHRMTNLRLRHELLPWLEALDEWAWVGKRVMIVLEALERGAAHEIPRRELARALDEACAQPKRTAGSALQPLARHVLGMVEHYRQPAHVSLPAPMLLS